MEISISLEDVNDRLRPLEGVNDDCVYDDETGVGEEMVTSGSGSGDGIGDGLGRTSSNSLSTEIVDMVGVLSGPGDGEG